VYGKINSFVMPFVRIAHHAVAVRRSVLSVSGVCVLSVI